MPHTIFADCSLMLHILAMWQSKGCKESFIACYRAFPIHCVKFPCFAILAKPIPMACQDTLTTGELDVLGYKEWEKGVSSLLTGFNSAPLLSLRSEGGQETGGTDMKPLLTQTAHSAPWAHIKAVCFPLSAAAAGGKPLCLPAPCPGHCRLRVLCSSTSCFCLGCRT